MARMENELWERDYDVSDSFEIYGVGRAFQREQLWYRLMMKRKFCGFMWKVAVGGAMNHSIRVAIDQWRKRI